MSGVEVVGGIGAVVGIIGGAVQLWQGARKDIKFTDTFATVAAQLPILLETLQICRDQFEPIQDELTSDVAASLLKAINSCKSKVTKLQQIFQETIPTEDGQWHQRYRQVLRRLGKGNKVEELMESIIQDTELLVNYYTVKSARPDLSTTLDKIKSKLESMEPSISSNEEFAQTFNTWGGQQNVSTGDSTQYISSNTGPGTTHNYGGIQGSPTFNLGPLVERDNFRYIKPYGDQISQAPDIGRKLFVGRRAELDHIHRKLAPEARYKDQRRVVLGGIGGSGKTQLAIAYAKEHTGVGGYSSIFWLNATSETTLEDSLRTIGGIIFDVQSSGSLNTDNLRARVHQWLSDPANTAWLLIFDNYDDPDAFDITPYYPPASHGAVLITSRRSDLVLATKIPVPPLQNMKECLDLLQQRLVLRRVHEDPHAHRLVERLAGLPLALATAASYLSKSRLTFEDYLKEYEERWNPDPRGRTVKLMEYQLGSNKEERTLYTTWNISYARLEAEDADAARLLKLCAYFDNQQLWYELFHAGLSRQPDNGLHKIFAERTILDSVARTLVDYGFLELNETSQFWSMHACVHDWTLTVLNKEINAADYWYTFDSVTTLVDQIEWDTLGHLAHGRLAPHVARLVSSRFCQDKVAGEISFERCDFAYQAAEFLGQRSQFAAGVKMYKWAMQGYDKSLGLENISTLMTVNNLGNLYSKQGNMREAEEMYQRALRGFEKTLGLEHISTLKTFNNLGSLYSKQGNMREAEEMYQRALQGYEKTLGLENISTLKTFNNLGNLYWKQSNMREAEKMIQRALRGFENTLGLEHIFTLNTVYNLGNLYSKQGNMREAEVMYQRALRGFEKTLSPEHTSTLDTVNNLGCLYSKQGKMREAEIMFQRALRGKEKAWGLEHTSTLDTVNNLAVLYIKLGRLEDMIALVSTWGSKQRRLFGALGKMLLRNSDDSNAQMAFQCQLVIRKSSLVFADAVCGRCGCTLTPVTGRAVCPRCDIDLCQKCLGKHQNGTEVLSTCMDHSFFKVVSEALRPDQTGLVQETQRTSWLQQLTLRWPQKQEEDRDSSTVL